MYVIINVGTERAHKKAHSMAVYKTEGAAKGVCTRLNREYTGCSMQIDDAGHDVVQWKVMPLADYIARPVKMVERTNLMSGLKYMEAEDTPNFCSPSSEAYWSS
jgi:hypothetical protein